MERDHGPPAEGAASFQTTRWTIIMNAAQSQAPGGEFALAQLCRTVSEPAEIDKEIHALYEELIESEERLSP